MEAIKPTTKIEVKLMLKEDWEKAIKDIYRFGRIIL
jgi:hypothetical protein